MAPGRPSPRRAPAARVRDAAAQIDLSDDEDDFHPNIDNASFIRMKHRSHIERRAMEVSGGSAADSWVAYSGGVVGDVVGGEPNLFKEGPEGLGAKPPPSKNWTYCFRRHGWVGAKPPPSKIGPSL